VLRRNFFEPDQLRKLVEDFHTASLTDEEVAIMEFAQKVVRAAHEITQDDIDGLRGYSLSDEEIMDIILAASARSFFALSLDALGLQPDVEYLDDVAGLEDTLSVGRPFAP
jgi:alkylhydroperoxidase family enzyme